LLKDFFIEAAEHMLQNSLGFNLNPLGDSGAPTNLHWDFPKSSDFVVLQKVAVFH
jgi:hypothetical protein